MGLYRGRVLFLLCRFSTAFPPIRGHDSYFTEDNGSSPTMAYGEIEKGKKVKRFNGRG